MTTTSTTASSAPPRRVPFLDLEAIHVDIRSELDDVYQRTMETNGFVGGDAVERFEQAWAHYCGAEHAVGVANGTDALELTLRAFGLGPGDEVIVPTNTFIATAEAVVAVGARPKLVDIDAGTLLLSPEVVEASVGANTAAIIAVHLYGEIAPMTDLMAIADKAGLVVIEDAAQAHGATWEGERAGSLAHAGCFSFYPGKNLGALGDGGAVVTDDTKVAETIRSLGNHGRASSHYGHPLLGRNSRLDALQAGFLEVKLGHLNGWNANRRRAADRYNELLADLPWVRRQDTDHRSQGVHHLYVVEVDHRDAIRDALGRDGIDTSVHYPVPCHQQPALAAMGHDTCRVAELSAPRLLSLPMSPSLTDNDIDWVCDSLARATSDLEATGEGDR